MARRRRRFPLPGMRPWLACAAALALAGCGGGSGGGSGGGAAAPAPVGPTDPSPTALTLTVSAGDNGSVAVVVNSAAAVTVNAGASMGFTAPTVDVVTLTAMPATGYTFDEWTLSDGLSCNETLASATCTLPAGSITGDASAAAAFDRFAVSWTGPGAVNLAGNTATATAYAPGTFIGWTAGPCAGTAALACDVSEATADAVAAFRPFTVAGIKALAFGLGYNLDPQPNHYSSVGPAQRGLRLPGPARPREDRPGGRPDLGDAGPAAARAALGRLPKLPERGLRSCRQPRRPPPAARTRWGVSNCWAPSAISRRPMRR